MRIGVVAAMGVGVLGVALAGASHGHLFARRGRDRGHRNAQQGPADAAAGASAAADAAAGFAPGPASSATPSAEAPPAGSVPCQSDAECVRRPGSPRGRCLTQALAAQYSQALTRCEPSGSWLRAHPVGTCLFDECNDADAPGGDTCPAGQRCGTLDMVQLPHRVCVEGACSSDLQCRREVGGRCASFLATGRCARGGWACSYPTDACAPRSPSRMCPQRNGEVAACRPTGPRGRFVCASEPVVPQGPVRL